MEEIIDFFVITIEKINESNSCRYSIPAEALFVLLTLKNLLSVLASMLSFVKYNERINANELTQIINTFWRIHFYKDLYVMGSV